MASEYNPETFEDHLEAAQAAARGGDLNPLKQLAQSFEDQVGLTELNGIELFDKRILNANLRRHDLKPLDDL